MKKVADFAQDKILHGTPDERQEFLQLSSALIQRYKSDRAVASIIKVFDRQIARCRPQLQYQYPKNQAALQKWTRAALPVEIFRDYPRFADFLESSSLLSQMKVTRDTVRVIDGEPALLVDGVWTKETDLLRRFEVIHSKTYDEKFLVEKETREIYTYLDNGKGLQLHHPYITARTPVSTLNDADYQRTRAKASEFIRPEEAALTPEERTALNQNRPFILQYVSSRIHNGTSNMHQLLRNPKHPYLRLIIGQENPALGTKVGEVYEVGYGAGRIPLLPFTATKGRFRSPDLYEFKAVDERIVTNIPISRDEARQFNHFTLRYHRDGINLGNQPGFSFIDQNCSVYTREACKAAGIDIPTEIDLKAGLSRITPEKMRKLGHQLSQWGRAASTWFRSNSPRIVPVKVASAFAYAGSKFTALLGKIRDLFMAFILTPICALLGGASGQGGRAFRQLPDHPAEIHPLLHSWRDFFNLSNHKVHLPGIAQEWQLRQPSTVVYRNPIKFAIVPNN